MWIRAQVDEMTKKMRQWSARVLYEDIHLYAGEIDDRARKTESVFAKPVI